MSSIRPCSQWVDIFLGSLGIETVPNNYRGTIHWIKSTVNHTNLTYISLPKSPFWVHTSHIWVIPKIEVPENGWFIVENPIKIDDLGGPPLIFGNTHIFIFQIYTLFVGSWVSALTKNTKILGGAKQSPESNGFPHLISSLCSVRSFRGGRCWIFFTFLGNKLWLSLGFMGTYNYSKNKTCIRRVYVYLEPQGDLYF